MRLVEVRSLGFRTDLMVRRLAGSTIIDHRHHLVVRTPANPSYHWGNFLLVDDLPAEGAIEQWIDEFRKEFPEAEHVTLGIDGTEFPPLVGYPSSIGLEVDLGVVLTGSVAPPPDPLPSGLQVRPLRTADDWRGELLLRHEGSEEEGPMAPGHSAFLRRSTAEATRLVVEGRTVYLGAFDGDVLCAVVGIASDGGGVARYQRVGTRTAYRRRGLASALVAKAGAVALSSMGARRLVIVADDGSPAARLYEALGFAATEAQLGLSVTTAAASGVNSENFGREKPGVRVRGAATDRYR